MQLTEITVTYGRKHNLGDYNSLHAEMTLTATIDDGDDEAAAAEALRNMAKVQVMLELANVNDALKAKVDNIFAGLPASVKGDTDAH